MKVKKPQEAGQSTGQKGLAMRAVTAVAAIAISLLLLPACAKRKGVPDPEKVQAKMAATLDAERELVRSTVVDADSAERLIELLAERDRLVAEQAERVIRYQQRMLALGVDYDAERADFDAVAATYNTERREWQREVAELIATMKAETTAEEWKKIARYELKNLNPRELAYEPAQRER